MLSPIETYCDDLHIRSRHHLHENLFGSQWYKCKRNVAITERKVIPVLN